MKDKIGKQIVRMVNRHWLLFGVFSSSAWGVLLGFWVGRSACNQHWWSFFISLVCSVVWMIIVFMQAYTNKENKK